MSYVKSTAKQRRTKETVRKLVWQENGGVGLKLPIVGRAIRRNAAREHKCIREWRNLDNLMKLRQGFFYVPWPLRSVVTQGRAK